MKTIWTTMSLLLAASAITGISTTGHAADLAAKPVYKAVPAVDLWNPWMIRVRALAVVPENGGSAHQVPGSSLKTSDQYVPELDISYFFTPNLAAELILGVTKHHVTGDGALAGLDVGKAWLLPPTLTFQYHFTQFGAFKPYIGAGVNYTWFFSQTAGNTPTVGGLSVTQSSLKDTAAPVLQFGFDYMIDKHWGWNVDVKKMWMRPNWEGTLADGTAITGQVKLDPWLIGTGITYKF